MEPLEVRVAQLHQEVCRLTALVDALPQRLLEMLSQQGVAEPLAFPPEESHKDVLPETWTPLPLPEGAPDLGLEWQVRRLTARLAYAHNRIAQLEEQLSLQQRRRWRSSPNSVQHSAQHPVQRSV